MHEFFFVPPPTPITFLMVPNHCIFLVIYLLKKKNTGNYIFETQNFFLGRHTSQTPLIWNAFVAPTQPFFRAYTFKNLTLRPCLIENFNSTAMLAHAWLQQCWKSCANGSNISFTKFDVLTLRRITWARGFTGILNILTPFFYGRKVY